MPTTLGKDERRGLIRDFLSRLRFPQLFLLLLALFAIDLATPDPILLVDEAILGVLTAMFGLWRTRTESEPEMKNVTPKPADD